MKLSRQEELIRFHKNRGSWNSKDIYIESSEEQQTKSGKRIVKHTIRKGCGLVEEIALRRSRKKK